MPETAITYDSKSMTEAEIQRRHILYQTSYTGSTSPPLPIRSKSPVKRQKIQKPKLLRKPKREASPEPSRKGALSNRDSSPGKRSSSSKSALGGLDDRRQTRADRARPWTEKTPKPSKKHLIAALYYDKALPAGVDKADIVLRPRRYVSNSKYGDIYEIRQELPKKAEKAPAPRKWLWEDEFLLWQKGSQEPYMCGTGAKTHGGNQSVTLSHSSRTSNLPSIKEHANRPSADLYASYHYGRLERTSQRLAVVILQRLYRGWHVRHTLKTLKRKSLIEHSKPWIKLIHDYRGLVAKIRRRYGYTKTSCPTDLKQIADYMDKKLKYDRVFGEVSTNGKLHREDLMEFFNRCDLWPTQRDINRCFDIVFRGSRNAAEVVFLLDCSSSIGMIGFHRMLKLVKDIVVSLDIAPDRTRVAVVPYNEDVFTCFGLATFSDKASVLAALSLVKIRHGLTRTDIALRKVRDILKESRPGVQKITILVTDGQSTYPDRTAAEARLVHDTGVQLFTIGIGDKADPEELGQLATSADHCYTALDVKSLAHIRRQIEKRLCLAACGFCQFLLPRIQKIGLHQHEVVDLLWTLFPPRAAGVKHVDILRKLPLDDDIMRATGMRACLRLVVQAKLERAGFVMVPSTVKAGVEKATSETQVMEAIDRHLAKQRDNTVR